MEFSLNRLIESASFCVAMLDAEGRYVAASPAWRAHFCPTVPAPAPLAGTPMDANLGFDLQAAVKACLSGKSITTKNIAYTEASGKTEYIDWIVWPWGGAGGGLSGVILNANFVTPYVDAVRKLEEGQKFFTSFFAESPIGLNLCQLDGLWIESNQSFLNMIGYTSAETDGGITYWDLTPKKYMEQERAQLEALEKTGRYGPYEKEFIHKDGHLVPVRLNGFIIVRDGKKYIWSIIEDITEKKRNEEEKAKLEHQIYLTARLASIGQLAAGVGHEINNPLTIVLGALDTVESRLKKLGVNDAILNRALDAQKLTISRITDIVRALRTLAWVNAPSDGVFDVNQEIVATVGLLKALYAKDSIDIQLALCTGDATVKGDSGKFQQVIMNLLANAKDAIPAGRRGMIDIATTMGSGVIKIVVTDNGQGIPKENLEKIFGAFFTTKSVGKGSGLGLSISLSIVSELGGAIELDSEEGKGARFTLTLPLLG